MSKPDTKWHSVPHSLPSGPHVEHMQSVAEAFRSQLQCLSQLKLQINDPNSKAKNLKIELPLETQPTESKFYEDFHI